MKSLNKTIKLISWIFFFLTLAGCYTIGESPTSLAEQSHRPKPNKLVPVLYVDGMGSPLDGNDKKPPFTEDDWPELYGMFKSNGYELWAASIHPKGHIDLLSRELFCEVKNHFKPYEKFHIVARSMGGLVTRLMLHNHPELADRVLSVTTIATPHRGSPIADFYYNGKRDGHWGSIQQMFVLSLLDFFPDDEPFKQSGEDLRLGNMCKFNQENPYDPKIPFFSMGFNIRCDDFWCKFGNYFPLLVNYPVNLISGYQHDEIALQNKGKTLEDMMNDGLVPVSSAKWGTYLGTFEGEHVATTDNSSTYRYRSIWKDVFEKVIVNLNHTSTTN